MGKNIYNNTGENQEVSKILGDLPKIKAPDNFEFNLMTRIRNKNFNLPSESKSPKSGFSWIFAPASVISVTIILMFFIFDYQTVEPENLLMSEPRVRINANADLAYYAKDKPSVNRAIENEKKSVISESEVGEAKAGLSKNLALRDESSPSPLKGKPNLPFNDNDAFDLDNYRSSGGAGLNSGGRPLTVGGGNNDDFEGFVIQRYDAQISVKKARIDSLIKALSENKAEKLD